MGSQSDATECTRTHTIYKEESNHLTSMFAFPPVSKLLSHEATTQSSCLVSFQNILCMYKQILMWIFVYMHKYSKKLYNAPFYPNGTAWNGFPACFYSLSSETLCVLRQAGGCYHFTQFGHKLFFIFFFSKSFWFFKILIYLFRGHKIYYKESLMTI